MPNAAAEKSIERRREERDEEHRNNVLIADAGWCWNQKRHPDWSIDDLLCHPSEALKMVRAVQKEFPGVPEDRICNALLNGRKRGQFSGKK